jgi:hypothetical protein
MKWLEIILRTIAIIPDVTIASVAIVSWFAWWKIFEKAGYDGWKVLVPFQGLYIQYELTLGHGMLFLLLFVPVVNIIVIIKMCLNLARDFGKGVGFGIGLIFFQPIFLLILALGNAEYEG